MSQHGDRVTTLCPLVWGVHISNSSWKSWTSCPFGSGGKKNIQIVACTTFESQYLWRFQGVLPAHMAWVTCTGLDQPPCSPDHMQINNLVYKIYIYKNRRRQKKHRVKSLWLICLWNNYKFSTGSQFSFSRLVVAVLQQMDQNDPILKVFE